MNYNNKKETGRWKFVAILAVCIAILGATIFLKTSSENEKDLRGVDEPAASGPQMAVPDTTIDTSLVPAATDSLPSTLPDTLLGRDERQPYEAGYEDGYAAGCDDGAIEQKGMSYDDENNFRSHADRADYVRGYKDGYTKGYDDGHEGKQFNIGE